MTVAVEVFESGSYPSLAAARIATSLEGGQSLVVTGGTTAERLYPQLARHPIKWPGIEVLFSDERCVPPNDPASNFGMVERLLLERASPRAVHRMPGEEVPVHGAELYHSEIGPLVRSGLDLVLLGLGADCHIGALYPGSMALDERSRLCVAVDRPDGMKGLTLTPPAILAGKEILLLVTGEGKAGAVNRVVGGSESVASCPARLLADHPKVTFLLDEGAARDL